ncbi:hypothetical protein BKA65DRAFT_474412 [Rhexocercosporidium sp. MPI-PUGE-AT-0058]|nr:hypothetical protein BKA65DRAFT_474412 [Rhexocercosporidium sp. MPI-PUGE-AT-0058]
MALEAFESNSSESVVADAMDKSKTTPVKFTIPEKRRPRGLMISVLRTGIKVRTPKFTTIARAASEPVDTKAELQTLQKHLEAIRIDNEALKECLEWERDSMGCRADAIRQEMMQERMVADIERARLRKKTFDQEMVLHRMTGKVDHNGQEVIGDFMFPISAVMIALEILRRECPDELMLSVYIEHERPHLEDSKYIRQLPSRNVRLKTLDEVDYKVSKGEPVDFKSALTAVGTALLPVL